MNILAFWPLNDGPVQPPAQTPALDLVKSPGPFPGQYMTAPNVPTYDNVNMSSAAPGTFAVQQSGIVPGDTPLNATTLNFCASFNGGFVKVPFAQALYPSAKFTVECWVQPSWTLDDVANTPAIRGVVVWADGAGSGFAITVTPDNFWAANIGIGTGFFQLKADTQQIKLGEVSYLAMSFDPGTGAVQLFVGTASDTKPTPFMKTTPSGSIYSPVTNLPLFFGKGRCDLTNGLFPLNGFIQDVAIYSTVLSNNDINTHFSTGIGS
jgi:hypothetical protein